MYALFQQTGESFIISPQEKRIKDLLEKRELPEVLIYQEIELEKGFGGKGNKWIYIRKC